MLTSCGIQWLAQVARYFSQAHLYLKGTSWLTSVWPLMMRLSADVARDAAASGCRARWRMRSTMVQGDAPTARCMRVRLSAPALLRVRRERRKTCRQ